MNFWGLKLVLDILVDNNQDQYQLTFQDQFQGAVLNGPTWKCKTSVLSYFTVFFFYI